MSLRTWAASTLLHLHLLHLLLHIPPSYDLFMINDSYFLQIYRSDRSCSTFGLLYKQIYTYSIICLCDIGGYVEPCVEKSRTCRSKTLTLSFNFSKHRSHKRRERYSYMMQTDILGKKSSLGISKDLRSVRMN